VRRARRRTPDLRDEAGFTLPELLTALVIGMFVLLAAFDLLDNSVALTTGVNRRVDALQRGRTALDQMTRDLRSQVCVGVDAPAAPGGSSSEPSLIAASDTSVDFYADLGDGSAAQPPERRTIVFDPSQRTIEERIYRPTGNAGNYVFPATPTGRRTLLTDVVQDGATPVFRYYAFDTAAPPTPSVLLPASAGLSTADLLRTVRIAIAFRSRSTDNSTTSGAAALQDDVYRRAVNPNKTILTPECTS
jgi:type II secretory pathway pseudopilin PulG